MAKLYEKNAKKRKQIKRKILKKRERTGGSRTSLNAIDSQGDSPAK